MKALHSVAFILLVIGGLNWLLIGINSGWNVVHMIFGGVSWLESLVYILVGLSALYLVFTHKATCKNCSAKSEMAPQM